MKTALFLTVVLTANLVQAKESDYQRATIVSMDSVPCGTQGKRHKKTRELLCQEYVLRSGSMQYRIRQKQEKSVALLPLGQEAEVRIKKDRAQLRFVDKDGKQREREFVVVEEKAGTE